MLRHVNLYLIFQMIAFFPALCYTETDQTDKEGNKMKVRRIYTVLLVLMLAVSVLTGCGGKSGTMTESAAMAEDSWGFSEEMAVEAPNAAFDTADNGAASAQSLPQNRKWVITMSISAETEDLDTALEAVNAQISGMAGYIEDQNFNNGSISSSRRSRSVSMTVRIPAENVDAFVQQISGVTNVVSSSKNVQDITLVYTDTESRITALKAEESRLLELMAKAENMSDLLEIEERLTEVRYRLEGYTSQLRRYDNQVDYATVDLYINQVQKYTPVARLGFWARTVNGFRNSLEDLGDTIVGIIEWLIVDIPYFVVLVLLVFGGVKLFRIGSKRSKEKKAALYQKRMQEYQAQQAAAQQKQNEA